MNIPTKEDIIEALYPATTITEAEKAILLDTARGSYLGEKCLTKQAYNLSRKLCLAHDALLAQEKIHKENVEMYSGLAASGIVRCAELEKERDAIKATLLCKGCGGTVGDHLAPDQGGCPGNFEIDGVPMVPLAGRDYATEQLAEERKEKDFLLSVLHVCWNWFDGHDDRPTSFELTALLKKVLSL